MNRGVTFEQIKENLTTGDYISDDVFGDNILLVCYNTIEKHYSDNDPDAHGREVYYIRLLKVYFNCDPYYKGNFYEITDSVNITEIEEQLNSCEPEFVND